MNTCLVIMPFRDKLDSHFELVQRCGEQLKLDVRRVDTYAYSGNILQAISKALSEADLVVVDLTNSNPNVMYELAIAQCLGKKVLLLTSDRSTVPFDLLAYRIELIDPDSPGQVERLCRSMQTILYATYINGPLGGSVVFGQHVFWRRAGAFLIDALPFVAVSLLGYLLLTGAHIPGVRDQLWAVAALGFILYVAATTAWLGATFGQLAVGLRVVTMDGDRPGFWRALGRVMSAIPLVGMTYGIGFLWCLHGPAFRALHDIASQTMVVRHSSVPHGAPT